MLLSFQQQFQQVCRDMKASTDLRRVIAWVVCGGGKSALPLIAATELIPTLADGLCWVSPRENLRGQAEDTFQDPFFKSLLGHNLELRGAINEVNPLRGKAAYGVTYDALAMAASAEKANSNYVNPHIKTFDQNRMILGLDEPNHIALGSSYHEAVAPLVKRAAVLIMMGGHFTRHDNQRIAFLDYMPPDAKSSRAYVDMRDLPHKRVIKYNLAEATRERQLIEIKFQLRDCGANWELEDQDGNSIGEGSISSFKNASREDTSRALFTALKTEFGERLLKEGGNFWHRRKQYNKRSKVLVVCTNISGAESAKSFLRRQLNIHAEVAHSNDPDQAALMIQRFRGMKSPEIDALVTVAMAYEGMNCPPADVLICLTRIRSREWIEQMLHRVSRYDRGGLPWEQQFATVFAPEDKFFLDIMEEINAAQEPYVVERTGDPPEPPDTKTKLNAIDSEMTKGSAYTFDQPPIRDNEYIKINRALEKAGLIGGWPHDRAKQFFDEMQSTDTEAETMDEETLRPSEREAALRDKIETLKRSGYNPNDPASVERIRERGRAIYRIFKKPVDAMTESELKTVYNLRDQWMR